MTAKRKSATGVTLVLVVMVMSLVAGLLTVLAARTGHFYRAQQADRAVAVARALRASAVAYTHTHTASWAKEPPAKPIELDVRGLVTERVTGTATIQVTSIDGRWVARVWVRTHCGSAGASDRIEIPLGI